MAKQEIAFGLKIDGIEQSIKSVKDLKGAISAMQTEAENADIGSDQYKNAIENIEKLNDKLKEVTQTEKQAAKATEDLAKAEQEAAKETGDLRKQFEVLEDELFLLAGQGKQNTKEFKDLSSEAAKLNAKIDQVNQTIGTGSSGVDKLSGSFGMLSEGFTSMNFDKVKAGFKGIGQAMSAVPLMLLVTGITMLAEKFELFKIIGEAVEKLFYAITDAMGLTSKAAEEQTASMIAGMQKQQDAINGRYDKEIKLSNGASVCLFHFPMQVWHKQHYGSYHLHGHCHGTFQGNGRILDVGLDNYFNLYGRHDFFTEEEVIKLVGSKDIRTFDGHVPRNGEM